MNFTNPPTPEDILALAKAVLESLPDELVEHCESLGLLVEELADEALEQELDLEDPFELVAFFRNGGQVSPGVMKKVANDDDVLTLFRRPLLDLWCETGDDISNIVRQVIIEELGQNFEFSESEIEDMTRRHHQGML